jgi:hypothetical protein
MAAHIIMRSNIIFTIFLALFLPLSIYCQTETLDGVQYTPPAGWAKTPKQGAVVFSDIDKVTNAFCILTVYGVTPSLGNARHDFGVKWNEWAVKALGAQQTPPTDLQNTTEGWQVVSAASQIELQGVKAVAVLTIVSGFGKVAGVLAVFNDQAYLPKVQAFLNTVKLDKAPAAVQNPAAGSDQGIDAQANDPFPTQPGYAAQKPLTGYLKPTITIADLTGTWDSGAGSVQTYIDTYTGNYVGTNTSFFGEKYVIHPDGTFEYLFVGRSGNRTVRETDGGTVSLSGGYVLLKFKGRDARKYQLIAFNTQPSGATILSLVGVHDKFQGYDPAGLKLECGHSQGFISCVGGEQWARLGAKPAK